MAEVYFPEESYQILGACFAVYKDKGHSFTEPIFHECLEIEFAHRKIPFVSKPAFSLTYRGQVLQHKFIPDFWCFDKIVLEIKALETLVDEHRAQVINYVHALNCDLGLLVNFGSFPRLQHERLFHSRNRAPISPEGEASFS